MIKRSCSHYFISALSLSLLILPIFFMPVIFKTAYATPNIQIPAKYSDNLSVMITNANSGEVIYQFNADKSLLIASNMKLFTSLFGLMTLKPDFQWHTKIYYTGDIKHGILYGNLYIKGAGDPTLKSIDLIKIFNQIKKNLGFHTINGNIIIDNSIFNSQTPYSMLTKDHPYDSDTITPQGLMIDQNLTKFILRYQQNKFNVNSNLFGYKIVNNIQQSKIITPCDKLHKHIQIKTTNKNSINFNGKISKNCNNIVLNYNFLPYFEYNKAKLNKILSKSHIRFTGQYKLAKIPSNAKLLSTISSHKLKDILHTMNHFSINLIAEAILLSAGAYTTKNKNTYLDSSKLFNDFLIKNNLIDKNFKLENGAGLSRVEYQSAKNIVALLDIANKSPYQTYFESSLPTPGSLGTLKHHLLPLKERFYAKTGTLNDTRAYSGYYYSLSGRKYIVSIIINNIDTQNYKEMKLFDSWVVSILNTLV